MVVQLEWETPIKVNGKTQGEPASGPDVALHSVGDGDDLPCISTIFACCSNVSMLMLADSRADLRSAKWIRSSGV